MDDNPKYGVGTVTENGGWSSGSETLYDTPSEAKTQAIRVIAEIGILGRTVPMDRIRGVAVIEHRGETVKPLEIVAIPSGETVLPQEWGLPTEPQPAPRIDELDLDAPCHCGHCRLLSHTVLCGYCMAIVPKCRAANESTCQRCVSSP